MGSNNELWSLSLYTLKCGHLQLEALDASLASSGCQKKYACNIEDLGPSHWNNEDGLAGRIESKEVKSSLNYPLRCNYMKDSE